MQNYPLAGDRHTMDKIRTKHGEADQRSRPSALPTAIHTPSASVVCHALDDRPFPTRDLLLTKPCSTIIKLYSVEQTIINDAVRPSGRQTLPVLYHEGKFPPATLDLQSLFPLVGPANAAVARYEGVLAGIPNPDILLSPLTSREAVPSSKIEGTQVTLP